MAEASRAGAPSNVALVVNPRAGGGKGARACAVATESLRDRGVDF